MTLQKACPQWKSSCNSEQPFHSWTVTPESAQPLHSWTVIPESAKPLHSWTVIPESAKHLSGIHKTSSHKNYAAPKLKPTMIRAVLTDIEGTTSSLSFVKDVLFPYAREHLPAFVKAHAQDPAVRELLQQVSEEAGQELNDEQAVEQLRQWIDQDRKVTPLKALQGLIWEAGYSNGDYRGHMYDDAIEFLRQWHSQDLRLYVYSSGSVYAQKLLFGHTTHGDLTALFSGYFDTNIGAKQEADAYRRIAKSIDLPAKEILFLSDIKAELDAAAEAGMATYWLLREGEPEEQAAHRQVRSFEQIRV